MNPVRPERARPWQARSSSRSWPNVDPAADRDSRTIFDAFVAHGGLATCEALAQRLRGVCMQPLSRLARWIVARDVVMLDWQGSTLLPLFQFAPDDWSVRAGVAHALEELRDIFDDRELALWFVTPNAWLGWRAPLHCVGACAQDLCHAARADRFIARG